MLLSDVWRLSVAYIGPKSRTERPRKDQNWHTGSPRHTWLGHHFQGQKVKGHGHQAALLSAALTCKAAVAVSVGTYSARESTATLHLLGDARRGQERGGGILCRHAHSLIYRRREFPNEKLELWAHVNRNPRTDWPKICRSWLEPWVDTTSQIWLEIISGIYWVAQLKWSQLTFLFVKFEWIDKILWFLVNAITLFTHTPWEA